MKLYAHSYQVAGEVAFPIDMLRCDNATPMYDFDSAQIMGSIAEASLCMRRAVSLRTINSNRNWSPTCGRWRSFGWTVVFQSLQRDPVQL